MILADKKITTEGIVNISFIEWSSGRVKCVLRNSLAAEAKWCIDGSGQELWHELQSGKELGAPTLKSLLVAEALIVCVDCKNIYDHNV